MLQSEITGDGIYTHFHSNKVFRGDHNLKPSRMRGTSKEYSRKSTLQKEL